MKANINPEYIYEVRKIIGQWLKDMREEHALTQEQLGERLGLDRATIAKIEAGRWNFGIDTVILFSYHLDFYPFFLPKESNDPLAKTMRDRWKRAKDEQ